MKLKNSGLTASGQTHAKNSDALIIKHNKGAADA